MEVYFLYGRPGAKSAGSVAVGKERIMIRNSKVLIAGAMVLTAFCALGAWGAQAAEFHCSVEPCRVTAKPSGEVGTSAAHQYFIVKDPSVSVGFTCNSISGEGTLAAKTATQLTLTAIEYQSCSIIGTQVVVKMNGCGYIFLAAGEMSIECPVGKKIEWVILNCTLTIGAQGPLPLVGKFKYRDPAGTKSELVVETAVQGIEGILDPSMLCGEAVEFHEAEIVTGNFLLTAETDDAEANMANVWRE